MATTFPPALPGRQIRPFPSRNPSYRALSIIDAYQDTNFAQDQSVAAILEEEPPLPPLPSKSLRRLASTRNEEEKSGLLIRQDSYSSAFDVEGAYGYDDADTEAEIDLDEIMENYDPYRMVTPPLGVEMQLPPRTSSRKVAPEVSVQEESDQSLLEPGIETKASYDDYDPYAPGNTPPLLFSPARKPSTPTAMPQTTNVRMPGKPGPVIPVPPKDGVARLTPTGGQALSMSTPKSGIVDKALPTVPRKSVLRPADEDENRLLRSKTDTPADAEKYVEDSEESRNRKDSLLGSDKGNSSTISSPRRMSPPTLHRRWPTAEEAAKLATRTLNRAGKPASLSLSRSNGSTAASVNAKSQSEAKVKALQQATVLESSINHRKTVSEPLTKLSTSLGGTDREADEVSSSSLATSPTSSSHVVSDAETATTAHSPPAEFATSAGADSLRNHVNITDDGNTSADNDMNRIKNLVKRKPIGGNKENQSISSIASDSVSSLKSTSTTKAARPHAQTSASSSTQPVTQESRARAASSTLALSPAATASRGSLEPFPLLEAAVSSETVIHSPKPEHGRPVTPPVLRSPTPLSQLEESPSKYGLKKKSERNLRPVNEERQSQMFGANINGVFRLATAQKDLRNYFTEDAPVSPIFSPTTVVHNEAQRSSYYQASLLNSIQERPRDSNAPQLTTIQLHCHNDHRSQWFSNDNAHYPVNCTICDTSEGIRWSCSSCGLRTCPECMEKIQTQAENTEFAILLREAKDETTRMRLEFQSRRLRVRTNTTMTERTVTLSRPGSPVVYPPSDAESPYGNANAAISTRSLPGNAVRPRPSQGELRAAAQYPPSAWNRIPAPPYGRPHGHQPRMSIGSAPGGDVPPTPRIPEQYLGDPNSKNSMPRSSKSSGYEGEMRGRAPGPAYGYGHRERSQGPQGYPSPRRDLMPGRREKSRPGHRMPRSAGLDPMAELRKGGVGAYPDMPRSAGARTPGSMQ